MSVLTHFVSWFSGSIYCHLDGFEICSYLWRVGRYCDCQVETFTCKKNRRNRMQKMYIIKGFANIDRPWMSIIEWDRFEKDRGFGLYGDWCQEYRAMTGYLLHDVITMKWHRQTAHSRCSQASVDIQSDYYYTIAGYMKGLAHIMSQYVTRGCMREKRDL